MTRDIWDLRVKGHRAYLQSIGWGEPQSISVSCSCGWGAPTVKEKWFTDVEKDFSYFAEPWRTIARAYGPDQTLRPNELYGTHETAVKLILDHLNYDPSDDLENAERLFKASAAYALETEPSEVMSSAEKVMDTAEELQSALQRARIWRDVKVPSLPDLIPEAQNMIEAHETAQRRERDERANTPLTEKEKAFLRKAGIQL